MKRKNPSVSIIIPAYNGPEVGIPGGKIPCAKGKRPPMMVKSARMITTIFEKIIKVTLMNA